MVVVEGYEVATCETRQVHTDGHAPSGAASEGWKKAKKQNLSNGSSNDRSDG